MKCDVPVTHSLLCTLFRVRIRHVDRDDGRYDDALNGTNASLVRSRRPTNRGAGQATRCNCLVRYRLVWVAFALFATLVQWALERSALLDFTMASTSHILGGLVFVTAGLYQWTRLNDLCLAQCQRPFAFVMRHGGYRREHAEPRSHSDSRPEVEVR
jgi:hypothetical protein